MVELLFTASIIWTTQKVVAEKCNNIVPEIGGCYVHQTNTIYLPTTKLPKGVNKYLVFYHESGHSLYWMDFPRDIFKQGIFSTDYDYETIADDFSWWICAKKFPKEKKFMESVINQKKRDFFASTCQKKCVDKILSIEIK